MISRIADRNQKLLQIDPNNEQAIFLSVYIEKGKCAKTSDAQACDDAEVDATRGLTVTKPPLHQTPTGKKRPIRLIRCFTRRLPLDDALSKKDFRLPR